MSDLTAQKRASSLICERERLLRPGGPADAWPPWPCGFSKSTGQGNAAWGCMLQSGHEGEHLYMPDVDAEAQAMDASAIEKLGLQVEVLRQRHTLERIHRICEASTIASIGKIAAVALDQFSEREHETTHDGPDHQ